MSIRESVTVETTPATAFQRFTADLAAWWPPEYTWSGETLERIYLEGRPGGHCVEIGPHDFRCDWGRVLVWEPPHRLVLAWQIAPSRAPEPDPAKASEVEIAFRADADGTVVSLEHRGFERHGEQGGQYEAMMGSEHGWPRLLALYAQSFA